MALQLSFTVSVTVVEPIPIPRGVTALLQSVRDGGRTYLAKMCVLSVSLNGFLVKMLILQ